MDEESSVDSLSVKTEMEKDCQEELLSVLKDDSLAASDARVDIKRKFQNLYGFILLATVFTVFGFVTPGWAVKLDNFNAPEYKGFNFSINAVSIATSLLTSIAIVAGACFLVVAYVKSLRGDYSVYLGILTSTFMALILTTVAVIWPISLRNLEGGAYNCHSIYSSDGYSCLPGYSYFFICIATVLLIISIIGVRKF